MTAMFADVVVPIAMVGTDGARAAQWGAREAMVVNASWFGEVHRMRSTGGYLAQPLVGVWASAPYFHNGSVPDLAGVLDSRSRPTRWQRTGDGRDDYDPQRVGWRWRIPEATSNPRVEYDTRVAGLGNAGHTYGDALSAGERADLLEYLRGL